MKKLIALLLALAALFTLFSCSDEYPPVESTEEESRVVMRLSVDGRTYDVKYELYRALFLSNKSTVDGGDDSVWSSENKAQYVEAINKIILDKVSDIYACIHLAGKIGDDVYSNEYENRIKEYIRINVEGNGSITGHGSYDAYLASLKDNYMNYSVSVLMMRYAYALERIKTYYYGDESDPLDKGGELSFTESDVKSFYTSDDCSRFLQAFMQKGVMTEEQIEDFRDILDSKSSDMEVALSIIGNTTATATDLISDGKIVGTVIGKYSLDNAYFSEYTEAAFSTPIGELSEVVTVEGVSDGYSDGYYILYRLDKSDDHFTEAYETIAEAYKTHKVGEIIEEIKLSLSENHSFTDDGKAIDHSAVSMTP